MFDGDGSGAFLPALTPELLEWLTGSAESISRALLRAGINDRTYRSVLRAAMAIGGFVPDLYVLADGRQRADFSIRQLGRALGHGENSLGVVQQALRVLSLTTRQSDPGCYRAACEALAAERAGNPIVRCIHKSSNRGESSIWELVDIRPRENSSDPTVSDFSDPVSGSSETVVDFDGTASDYDKTVSEKSAGNRRDCTAMPARVEHSRPKYAQEEGAVPESGTSLSCAASDNCRSWENNTAPNSSTNTKLLYGREFDQFINAYGHGPGCKREETYRAFQGRIRQGYTAEQLIKAAGRYQAAPYQSDLGERYVYPLKFLEDVECLRAYCSRAGNVSEWSLENAELSFLSERGRAFVVIEGENKHRYRISFPGADPQNAKEARELICGPLRDKVMHQMQETMDADLARKMNGQVR